MYSRTYMYLSRYVYNAYIFHLNTGWISKTSTKNTFQTCSALMSFIHGKSNFMFSAKNSKFHQQINKSRIFY